MAEEVEMTPITPAESGAVPPKVSPFGAPPPASAAPTPAATPAAAPAATPSPAPAAPAASDSATVSTIKLKPIIRKPMIRKPVVGGASPAAPAAPAASKKATQSLKAVTGPMPAQATLRKTGIIAEGILTPAQQQAAKSKTSRISLESAIGVAPVKETPAPMKTIRLRRPTDIKSGGPAPLTPPSAPPAEDASTAATVAAPAPASEGADPSATQKKTLKLHRPSIGVSRPTLGVNRSPKPAAPAAGEEVADMPVAEMATVTNIAPLTQVEPDSKMSAGVPGWVATLSLITSVAALAAVGTLMWYLWQEGVGPVAGANEMQFIQM